MTMQTCDAGHNQIVYDDENDSGHSWKRKDCPLCTLMDEKKNAQSDFEDKIFDLNNKIEELEAEIKDLKASIHTTEDE